MNVNAEQRLALITLLINRVVAMDIYKKYRVDSPEEFKDKLDEYVEDLPQWIGTVLALLNATKDLPVYDVCRAIGAGDIFASLKKGLVLITIPEKNIDMSILAPLIKPYSKELKKEMKRLLKDMGESDAKVSYKSPLFTDEHDE